MMAEQTAKQHGTANAVMASMERVGLHQPTKTGDEEGEEDEEEEDEEEDELRRAARAGILLLEKNTELQHENAALRTQVKALESERPRLAEELERRASELELLREERRQGMLEVTRLQGELRATSQLVTTSLDRAQRYKQQKETADAAVAAADDKMQQLRQEMVERSLVMAETFPVVKDASVVPSAKRLEMMVVNPAATYDSNQRSAFTLADHEELLTKWQRATAENESLLVEMKSLKKDVDAHKRRAAKLSELAPRLERLEKKTAKLQLTNDTLVEELTEERALSESQRTMIAVYKKIADARPFSTECTCALHPEDALGVSVQEQLLENNMRLEKEARELRARLSLTASMVKQEDASEEAVVVVEEEEDGGREEEEEDPPSAGDSIDNNSSHHTVDQVDELLRNSEAETGEEETVVSTATDVAFLIHRIQSFEEKQSALKDSLRHAKHQWQAAIASQKALEECNRAAQAEISRLTQQVDHKVSALSGAPLDLNVQEDDEEEDEEASTTHKAPDGTFQDADDDEKWMEEMAPYPAPPGDLNSPLIKCLLDHWTTDKSKIMRLTDWLHHAIRGTGKPRPLRLEHLTSEVAAGFTQLLVPILRERHGVAVKIYRRESIQILTDMVFQAHQPAQPLPEEAPSLFSTIAAALSSVMAPSANESLSLAEDVRERVERSPSQSSGYGSGASSEAGSVGTVGTLGTVGGARARRRRQDNSMLMSEAHFLYG